MKLIFAGTPEFAEQALMALIAAGHEIAMVLTQPDRPAGRGKKLQASPVRRRAQQSGLPVFQPAGLRKDPAACEQIAAIGADAMVVAAYGLILPPAVLAAPRLGCINIHASLLPRWRGAAPIQRAIEAGDAQSGITIMQMDSGLDTGDMLLVRPTPIGPEDTGGTLHNRLAQLGAEAIVDVLASLEEKQLTARPQPDSGATYAQRLTREDARIDWSLNADQLVNRIRAFDPVPGSAATLVDNDLVVKIWRVEDAGPGYPRQTDDSKPGQVIHSGSDQLIVACGGGGAVRVLELQRAGARRLPVRQFQPASLIPNGARFLLAETG